MLVKRHVALILAAAGAVACADVPLDPELSDSAPAYSIGDEGRIVSGSGHVELGMTEDLREFTFHAVTHPDGSVSGSYKVERTDIGVYFVVQVTCMTVVGNRAWVAGTIAESNSPAIRIGSVSYFWTVDNGEGAGAAPDIVSVARINDRDGEDALFCSELPTVLPPLTVQKGNVQIH